MAPPTLLLEAEEDALAQCVCKARSTSPRAARLAEQVPHTASADANGGEG